MNNYGQDIYNTKNQLEKKYIKVYYNYHFFQNNYLTLKHTLIIDPSLSPSIVFNSEKLSNVTPFNCNEKQVR